MANSDNIVSELLGAIDTVVGKRLGQLSYDKTIICTIIDDSNAKNGEYRVTDGSVKFLAKCENTSYRKDEQVRVSVPNGDTTQEKFIIGKYVKDNSNTPITYMTPLSSVLQMSGNLIDTNNFSTYGLKASGNGIKDGVLLWSAGIDNKQSTMISNQIYDVIYIQADFKTILSNYNITSGTYGLLLQLSTTLADGQPGPAVNCLFDSTQMMGNPYAFGIYTTQAAKFDITNVGKISNISLTFYQDGNFMHTTHSTTSEPVISGEINNILIKNIQVGFGSDLMNVADETVKLFTPDSLVFDNNSTVNSKQLKFAWYNKDENGKYIGFEDGMVDGVIKFIDEDEYLQVEGANERLRAQRNYDIPMDEAGLGLAADTRTIKDILLSVSKSLSVDLFDLLNKFAVRCDIAGYSNKFNDLKALISQQNVTVGETSGMLPDVINDMYKWYMEALNMAAVKYNHSILPTQLEGEWEFAYNGEVPLTLSAPDYYTAFSAYFTEVESAFYQGEDKIFLQDLLSDYIDDDYSGYRGIYDDFNRRITKLITKQKAEWEKALSLLEDSKEIIEAYFSNTYHFNAWVEQPVAEYENGYCVYWYRYNPTAVGDNFVTSGWERITQAGYDNIDGIDVELDAVHMVKEEFKVLVFFNHERYESNVVSFENLSPVISAEVAALSDSLIIKHGEKSQESYQSYSIANTLINGADKYIKRELSVEFSDGANGIIDDLALVNTQIYWYIPDNATMLTYDLTDLQGLNPQNKFINDVGMSDEKKTSDRQRKGFTSFYKTIGYGMTEEQIANKEYVKDLKFCYRIKDYYSPASAQNTIFCEIVKGDKIYKGEILMNFSSYGTSGTDYTLVVSPITRQAALTLSNYDEDTAWKLDVALYNNKNEKIDIPNLNVSNIVTNSAYKAEIFVDAESGEYYCKVWLDDDSKSLCGILEFTIEDIQHSSNENMVNLKTYFPVPYAAGVDYYIEGGTVVVYDSQGGNPSYYKDPYMLFKQGTEENNYDTTPPEGSWEGFMHYTPGGADDDSNWLKTKAYLPTISKGALKPANMWVDGGDCTYDDGERISHCAYYQYVSNDGNIIWSQPILIMQNRYPSPMLNAWDGEFKIDEKNGTIMSTMVGAGRKTKNNTFEGVLMGDIEAGAGFNPDNKSGLGLYGFNDGAQSFGFNIDGTAFLGKSGRGRILFDGNSGSISSASYQQTRTGNTEQPNTAGMMIDLDDGFIDMLGTKKNDNGLYETDGTRSRVHLDVKSPYFYIKSKTGVELIHIGDKGDEERTPDYYLQTNDFKLSELWAGDSYQSEKDSGAGMKLNLAQGKIQAYNFELRGEDSRKDAKTLGSYVFLSSDPADMVRVRYRNNDFDTNGIDVLAIGTNNYILKSFNWWDEASDRVHDSITPKPLTGMQINLQDGIFEAYAENGSDATNWFRIDASYDSIVPLAIGNRGNPAFKVHWDGSLSINDDAFIVDKDGNITMAAGSIKIGDNFAVDKDGILQATSATMNKLTAIGAALTDLTVTNDAQFNGSINSTGNATFAGAATFGGNTSITGTITTTGAATFGGNTEITGNLLTKNGIVTLGGDTRVTGTFTTEGTNVTVTLGGNTTITGTLNTTGTATFGGNTFITGIMTIGDASTSLGRLITYGSVDLKGATSIAGPTTITGNLTTTGDSVTVSLGGTTTVKGDLKITDAGSLSVSGVSTFTGKTTINNSLEIAKSGTLSVSGKSTLSSLDVTGNSTFKAVQFNSTIAVGDKFGKTDEKTLDIPWSLKVVTLKFTNGICTDIVEGNKEGEEGNNNVPVVAQDWADKRYVQHGQNKAVSFTWANLADKPSAFTPATHNNDAHYINYASEDRVSDLERTIDGLNAKLNDLEGRVSTLEGYHNGSTQPPGDEESGAITD